MNSVRILAIFIAAACLAGAAGTAGAQMPSAGEPARSVSVRQDKTPDRQQARTARRASRAASATGYRAPEATTPPGN